LSGLHDRRRQAKWPGLIQKLVARLIEAGTRLQDELQEARADADHAKAVQVRMARDVANMFEELRALADRHAELHVDQARRPWWRRFFVT
jgi:hypothetical protein